jgi:hypothetical protein
MSAHRCVRAFSPGRESRQDLGLVLTRYAIERLLYRIGVSRHADYFLLKRALLFDRWFDVPHRPTRAVDLPGFGSAELSLMESTFKEISAIAEDDGMTFDPDTVRATEIRKDAPPTSLYVHSPSCTSPLTACRQAAARRRSRAPPGEIDMGTFRIGRTGFFRLGRAAVAGSEGLSAEEEESTKDTVEKERRDQASSGRIGDGVTGWPESSRIVANSKSIRQNRPSDVR